VQLLVDNRSDSTKTHCATIRFKDATYSVYYISVDSSTCFGC